MAIRKFLLAAAASALRGLAAAGQMMSPAMAPTPEAKTALMTAPAAQRTAHRLDADHGVAISRQHPGVDGAQVTRVDE